MRRNLFTIGIVVLLLAGSGTAWYASAPLVEVTRPVRGPAVHAVFATGNVEPVTWAKVTPMVRGRIEEQCRCEGEPVDKGTVLARLENREARAEVRELEARAKFLKEEVVRYRSLLSRSVVSTASYDRILSDYMQVTAAVSAARERLAHFTLEAPLDGIVLRRDGEVGEVVAPGDVIFWVGQPRPLWIVAEVDEEDIPSVKQGQRTLIKSDAFPGRVLEGTVDRITPKGDPINKSYRVRVLLPADSPLLIGMTTEINVIVGETTDALLVPASAIDRDRLWVVEEGRAKAKPIRIGIRGQERAEVLKGIAEDAEIITDPPPELEEGARVRRRR